MVAEYDKALLVLINHLGTPRWDMFWMYATNIAAWIPLYVVFLFLVIKKFTRQKALAITVTVVLTLTFTLLFTELIKEWIQRLRPVNDPAVYPDLRIVIKAHGYSFFSGHASNSVAVTTLFICFLRKKLKWVYVLYGWPLLFGLSRLYFGVHYPTDVLTGWLAGFVIALIAYTCLGRTLLNYAAYREAVTNGK